MLQQDYSISGGDSLFEASSIVLKHRHSVSGCRKSAREKLVRKQPVEKPYVVYESGPAGSKVKSFVQFHIPSMNISEATKDEEELSHSGT